MVVPGESWILRAVPPDPSVNILLVIVTALLLVTAMPAVVDRIVKFLMVTLLTLFSGISGPESNWPRYVRAVSLPMTGTLLMGVKAP